MPGTFSLMSLPPFPLPHARPGPLWVAFGPSRRGSGKGTHSATLRAQPVSRAPAGPDLLAPRPIWSTAADSLRGDPVIDRRAFLAGTGAVLLAAPLVADARRDVQILVDGRGTRSPVIAQGHTGPRMTPARGISIYFPLSLDRSVFYRELDFASATQWADLLEASLGNGRTPETRLDDRKSLDRAVVRAVSGERSGGSHPLGQSREGLDGVAASEKGVSRQEMAFIPSMLPSELS